MAIVKEMTGRNRAAQLEIVKPSTSKIHVSTALASLVSQTVKNLPARQETQVQSLGQEDPLEKGMATHSSILEKPTDSGL